MSEAAQMRPVAFLAALAAIAAALPLGYFAFLREPPPPPPPPAGLDAAAVEAAPDAAIVESLELAEVSGSVQVRHGRGEFMPAIGGLLLKVDDSLRTLDGRARLIARDSYDVAIEPGTELEIEELAARLSRLKLGLGMLVARVGGSAGRRLQIEARGSDAVASSVEGTFAISNNGAGTVAVGARAGEVELRAAGKAVILRQGQQSIALPGGAPSEPAPIPPSLFLKIDWPGVKETNRRQIVIGGRTAPGAVMRIAGEATRVEKNGRFSAAVRLREGRNDIVVEGADVGGHRAQDTHGLRVDTAAPDSTLSTEKVW
jgi:hypothetical protein